MKQTIFGVAIAALTLTILAGCGGGGGSESGDVTRELLAGTDQRTWKLVAIRGNANYEGGSTDAPCPASLKQISDPSLSFRCGSSDRVVMRSGGTFTYLGVGVDWSLSGSTVTLNLGSSLGVLTSSVSVEPVAAGAPKRLRLRQVSRAVGSTRNTTEDGSEIVIEEEAMP